MSARRRPPRLDRRALRERQRALRAELRQKRGPARRRRWPWLLLLLLLLLCLLPIPSCEEAPGEPEAPEVAVGESAAPVEPEPEPPTDIEPVRRFVRPKYTPPPPDPIPWLEVWRLQVAARGPRLAACFEGVSHPGALRWTTRVEPASGRTSDHVLDPVLDTEPVSAAQRRCVLGVLTEPAYRLGPGDAARVSIVIEF